MSFADFISNMAWANLVYALAHTLWAGALIATVLAVTLNRLGNDRVDLRYGVVVAGLLATLLSGLVAWAILAYEPTLVFAEPVPVAGAMAVVGAAGENTAIGALPTGPVRSNFKNESTMVDAPTRIVSGWIPWIAAWWLFGVALMLARQVRGLSGARLLRAGARLVDDPRVQALLDRWALSRKWIGHVPVMVCDRVAVPAVVGLWRMTILFPASMLSGASPEVIEAALAHELAHVCRRDTLVNFVQMTIEALLFFNPAVWWISRQIRIEREAVCDAWAARLTGPAGVARALAETALVASLPASAMALGSGGSHRLLDRVQRLLVPGYRPRAAVSRTALFVGLLVIAVLLVMAKGGIDLTVNLAGKILTPSERIAKMEEIRKEISPMSVMEPGMIPGMTSGEEKPEMTVSGRLRTWDGAPLPDKVTIGLSSESGSQGSISSGIYGAASGPDGVFSYNIQMGTLKVIAHADGYALVYAEGLRPDKDGNISGLDLVLGKYWPMAVVFQDTEGKPIPGVNVLGGVEGYGIYSLKGQSDAQGLAVFDSSTTHTLNLRVAVPGYQDAERKSLQLTPGKPEVWVLEKAIPLAGWVVDAGKGTPIAGAKIRAFRCKGGMTNNWSGNNGPVYDISDAEGRFSLDRLRDDTTYAFTVHAEGYAPCILEGVEVGQPDLKAEMQHGVRVEGRLIVDPEAKNVFLIYTQPDISGDHDLSFGDGMNLTPDKPGEYPFSIDQLNPGELKLEIFIDQKNVATRKLQVGEVTEPVTIDLTKNEDRPLREVVWRLVPPEGQPTPTGTINVSYVDKVFNRWMDFDMPLENGEVHMDVPPVNMIQCQPTENLPGYGFSLKMVMSVPEGEDPFVIEIPVTPSGMIHGVVMDLQGAPLTDGQAWLIAVERASALADQSFGSPAVSLGDGGHFMLNVPLGGVYRVAISHGCTYQISESIEVNEKNPIREVSLTMPEGMTLRGQILKSNGESAQVSFFLRYETPWGFSLGGSQFDTDPDGSFELTGINPDVPGEYRLQTDSRADFVPLHVKVDPLAKSNVIKLTPGKVLEGVVIDEATGRPVIGTEVFASGEKAWHRQGDWQNGPYNYFMLRAEGLTDEKGRFRFSNLLPEAYNLNVQQSQQIPDIRDVQPGGDPLRLVIRIPKSRKDKVKLGEPETPVP